MTRIDLAHVRQSPKSTVIGLCILALAAERGVHFDGGGHLAMNARDWFEVGCGALSALVSALSQDATNGASAGAEGTQPLDMADVRAAEER